MKELFRLATLSVLFAAALPNLAATAAGVEVQTTDSGFVVTGITHGKNAVLFGVTKEQVQYQKRYRSWSLVAEDSDRDGRVEFLLPELMPESVWVIVDQHTGDWAAITRQGMRLPVQELPRESLTAAAGGEYSGFDLSGASTLHVIAVRQDAGVWQVDVDQDGRNDQDRGNHRAMRIGLEGLRTISGGVRPKTLVPGDLLVAIDPFAMRVYVGRISR